MRRRDLIKAAGACLTATALPSESFCQNPPHRESPLLPGSLRDGLVSCGEPHLDAARLWWPEPRNVWTPIGWKDHLFRFVSVYNGSLLCAPAGWLAKPDTEPYRKHENLQLNFTASPKGKVPPIPAQYTKLYKTDGGIGTQGWIEDKETPVLWTEWRSDAGIVVRQSVFAHVRGAAEIKTGTEPLYAWIRLSVAFVHPVHPPKDFTFGIQLSQVYYDVGGSLEDSVFLAINPPKAPFATPMSTVDVPAATGKQPGMQITQHNEVRLLALPGGDGKLAFHESAATARVYELHVTLPAQEGAYTDLLVPMLAEDPATFNLESRVGFDRALAEAETYWSRKPATAARIRIPEKSIEQAIRRNLQFAEIIAERNPDTGDYSFLTGAYGYDQLWTTPTSMLSHMFLDLLGYHDVVEKHVSIYKRYQGTIKPPGPAYKSDPGYFSTPRTLTAIDWLSDHGAVLELLGIHGLLTGRESFCEQWIDAIVRGCEFVERSCEYKDTGGVEGIMPPAVATDTGVPLQAVWSEAWAYRGFCTAVSLLQQRKHPRASEFEALSSKFKEAFRKAFVARIDSQPTWTNSGGEQIHILPTDLIPPPKRHDFDDAFLLDTGPLVLPWARLYDAAAPEMISFENFFRYGPNNRLRGPQTGPITRAVLKHEVSSCEVCYSWNVVNSWIRGDRELFLEGMYSLLAAGLSPQTYINCEHRNAMYGTLFVIPLATWAIRQAVIDDRIIAGELHLLRLCPLAWIPDDGTSLFERMPTFFGVVNLEFGLSDRGKTLNVKFSGEWRNRPSRIVLHCPPLSQLEMVVINGEKHRPSKEIVI